MGGLKAAAASRANIQVLSPCMRAFAQVTTLSCYGNGKKTSGALDGE